MAISTGNRRVYAPARGVWMRGVTLVELMTTLAIVAIMATAGLPMFRELSASNRITAHTNEFLTSLYFARSEAVMRGQRVVVCRSNDGATCATSGRWDQGWIVFVDLDNNAAVTAGDTVRSVHAAINGNITMTGNGPVSDYISYSSEGRSVYTTGGIKMGTISLCDPDSGNKHKNAIVISSVGRPRTDKSMATC